MPSAQLYERVYWDTEELFKKPRAWPIVSAEVARVLSVLTLFKIPAVLLEPVEKQLEAHWMREFKQSRDATAAKLEALSRMSEQVGLTKAEPARPFPSNKEVLTAYRKAVDQAVAEHKFLRAAPRLRETSELFGMAIWRQKPFGEEGKNFQDAVILLAAIDDMRAAKVEHGAFVSRDGDFDQATIDSLAGAASVSMTLFTKADQVLEEFKSHLKKLEKELWAKADRAASEAVNADLEPIQNFIKANLKVPENAGGLGCTINSVADVRIRGLKNATTPVPWALKDGEQVTVTAQLELAILANVLRRRPSNFASPRFFRIGADPQPPQATSGWVDTVEDTELILTATVTISAVYKDQKFINLDPVSVSLDTRSGFLDLVVPSG